MFVVTEADAAAIRAHSPRAASFQPQPNCAAGFPALPTTVTRECARTIAGWKPLPLRPLRRRKAAPGAWRSTSD